MPHRTLVDTLMLTFRYLTTTEMAGYANVHVNVTFVPLPLSAKKTNILLL